MTSYFLKRLLYIIPTVWFITVVAFIFSKNTPQDTASSMLALRGVDADVSNEKMYEKVYKELNLDQPLFYFSIVPSHYPRTQNVIVDVSKRKVFKVLLQDGIFYKDALWLLNNSSQKLVYNYEKDQVDNVELALSEYKLEHKREVQRSGYFLPKFYWNGSDNQYHHWFKQMFSGGFGPSIIDGQSSISKVSKALKWTLSFTLIDFLLSLILALWIGYYVVLNANSRLQKWIQNVLYILYAIPVFWLATMFVIYFTNDNFGSWTNIFPSVGIDIYPGKSTFEQIVLNFDRLILPILILTLHSLAYVTRFISQSLDQEMKKDYISLAYSKGLSRKEVLGKHAFRNAWIPIVTVFVSAFAAIFSGSLVIEVIFNIPGMGRLMYNSITQGDWNVAMCILVIASVVTVLSYIIGDLLYYYFTPKMKVNKS